MKVTRKQKNKMQKIKERAVLVTTKYKGVFFGYAEETNGETVKLRRARNCIYWPSSNQGFMGLAEYGPMDSARIGPRADIELRGITSVCEVTEEAPATATATAIGTLPLPRSKMICLRQTRSVAKFWNQMGERFVTQTRDHLRVETLNMRGRE